MISWEPREWEDGRREAVSVCQRQKQAGGSQVVSCEAGAQEAIVQYPCSSDNYIRGSDYEELLPCEQNNKH